MNIHSGHMVQLALIIMEEDVAEDYAFFLGAWSQDFPTLENQNEGNGFLILQLLINNISWLALNASHMLLKFDVDAPMERIILQP